jgi:hypothetical protein
MKPDKDGQSGNCAAGVVALCKSTLLQNEAGLARRY